MAPRFHLYYSASVFQPTLPHRERRRWSRRRKHQRRFQPTLPHRERPDANKVKSNPSKISTHAPAQGATTKRNKCSTIKIRFQPTLPHRERQERSVVEGASSLFQPTLPHRERRPPASAGETGHDFNPRSRTGSDPALGRGKCELINFNPRSRTGSDAAGGEEADPAGISTHAPAQGATDGR